MTLAFVQPGETLTIPCPAAGSTLAQWMQVGGILGQALKTTTSGLDLELWCPPRGTVVRMTKVAGFVPALGDIAYYDFTDGRLESSGRPVGFYAAAALTGDTAARVVWDPAAAEGAAEDAALELSVHVAMVANQVVTYTIVAPFACTVSAPAYFTDAKPTSAGGAATLAILNGHGGNTMLNAASISLETATENAKTALTVTATAADLVVAKGGLIEIVATSDNADLVVGSGIDVFVTLTRTY